MYKVIIFLQILFITSSCFAQSHYSSSSKKAISYFEEAMEAPNTMNLQTGMPNYPAGIELLIKAIEKDPKFWEAHLVIAEFYEATKKFPEAIKHFEEALAINPNHTVTGSTYFYLANVQQLSGDYEGAIQNLNHYVQNRSANPDLVNQAYAMRENCEFAVEAMKTPYPFEPINMGPGINTKDPEYYPTITVDGKMILFTRRIDDQRVPVFKKQEDFYFSKLSERNIWGTAEAMPPNINTLLNEGAPTISADGRSLIFVACSDQSGNDDYGQGRTGFGSCD